MAAKRRKTPTVYYAKSRNRTPKKVLARRGAVVFLLTLLGAGLLGGAYWGLRYTGSLFFSRNPKFELKNIEITSDGRLTPEFFRERAGLREGMNLFELDLGEIGAAIRKVPMVQTVHIERKLPDTLLIRVAERVALAQIRWHPRALPFLVDYYGVVIPMTRSGQSLPLIEGLRATRVQPGDRIEQPGIRQCLDILTEADELGLGAQVAFSSFDIRYPDFVTTVINGDISVRFPQHSARDKLIRLVSVLQLAAERGQRVRTVDLTPDGRNVPVTFHEPPPAPAPGAPAAPGTPPKQE